MESIAAFQSNLIVTTDLLAATPDLELAFENFLRNVRVHATIITALRVNEKFDRWTFVCLNDAEAGKKSNAAVSVLSCLEEVTLTRGRCPR